jgi:hypothetical protein
MVLELGVARGRRPDAVTQFSVFTPNRMGRLHEVVKLLGAKNVHMLALTVLDTTDSAILRFVVDDPDKARELLDQENFSFTESGLVVVELTAADQLSRLIAALLEAEVNINYLYSFIPHPNGKSLIGLSIEDNDIAEQVLRRHQFTVLRQSDISR